jgi:hypothetical protein
LNLKQNTATMTVKELIQELEKHNQDLPAYIQIDEANYLAAQSVRLRDLSNYNEFSDVVCEFPEFPAVVIDYE